MQTTTFTMRNAVVDGILLVRPTREDVQSLRVGDLAPDCFGKLREVTEIFGAGDDICGKAFVCYYTRFGATSTVSNSLKEDETLSTTATTARWHRSECYPKVG